MAVMAALFCAASGTAMADDSLSADLIEKSGISEHLALVPTSIAQEAWSRLELCQSEELVALTETDEIQSDEANFTALVEKHFGLTTSRARAIEAMNGNMNVKQRFSTKKFFDSDLGQRIVAAEEASKDVSEDEFVALAEEYFESSYWTDDRESLIRVVYESTNAARFVSILNGELTVAVEVSSHCEPTLENYQALGELLKTTRTDARLIEPIMANDLIFIIATTFRELTDRDLVEYLEFARSDDGKAFYNALLESTRRAISGGLKGFRDERIANYEQSLSAAKPANESTAEASD